MDDFEEREEDAESEDEGPKSKCELFTIRHIYR